MAGLLEGVLPWLYSTGDTLKRNVRGLISDPAGWASSLGQDFQTANQQRSEAIQGLLYPSVMQTPQDRQAAYGQMTDQAMNLMAPTVYHGSPHSFSAFDASKIGTGEGAQAYGHGLYFAENPGVANSYAEGIDKLGGYTPELADAVFQRLAKDSIHGSDAISWGAFSSKTNSQQFRNVFAADPSGTWAKLSPNIRTEIEKQFAGNLYKVNLPDEMAAKMLDWDKPLSQQAPEVQKALQAVNERAWPWTTATDSPLAAGELLRGAAGTADQKSELLRKAGIPGIRYLDQGSRGTGTGTSNYVVFPGGEGLLNIMERNGQPVESGLLGRTLPPRTADTMSDAIAIASPNGRMSQRAKDAATKALGEKLFGPGGATREMLTGGPVPQPTQAEALLRQAAQLRDLASRGMSVKKFTKQADLLEQQAAALKGS